MFNSFTIITRIHFYHEMATVATLHLRAGATPALKGLNTRKSRSRSQLRFHAHPPRM